MSRRQLTLVVLSLASLTLAACGTSPTAPHNDAPKEPVFTGSFSAEPVFTGSF